MFIPKHILLASQPINVLEIDAMGVECISIRELLDEFEPFSDEDDGLIHI